MEFKVNLATMTAVREAVPAELRGLLPDTLRNLQQALDPVPEHLVGIEYWPGVDITPQHNPETEALGDETLTCDPESKSVLVKRAVVPIPAAEVKARLDAVKAAHMKQIEDTIVAVYAKPTTLAREYLLREGEAQAYVDSGYTADVDPDGLLKGFAIESGMALDAAADRVLAQAAAFRIAEPKLGNLRMKKYAVQRATTKAQADAILANVMAEVAAIVKTIG
jgi:hypothetical protein